MKIPANQIQDHCFTSHFMTFFSCLNPRNNNFSQFSRRKRAMKRYGGLTKNFYFENFGDLSQFWGFWDFDIDFKILKKVCKDCSPIFWPILENFDFRIWVKSQSYDKPPWRNFVFWSKFEFRENRKFQILNPSSNPNFGSLALNPNFRFWQICGFCSI